jgi:hypothetical protein
MKSRIRGWTEDGAALRFALIQFSLAKRGLRVDRTGLTDRKFVAVFPIRASIFGGVRRREGAMSSTPAKFDVWCAYISDRSMPAANAATRDAQAC